MDRSEWARVVDSGWGIFAMRAGGLGVFLIFSGGIGWTASSQPHALAAAHFVVFFGVALIVIPWLTAALNFLVLGVRKSR